MKFQPHLTSKPPTRKERQKLRALALSRRNSPAGQPTKEQQKVERKHKTEYRKMRQTARRMIEPLHGLGEAFTKAGTAVAQISEATPGLDVLGNPHLSEQTVPQLRELAKKKGIKVTTKMKKQEVIDLLNQQERN